MDWNAMQECFRQQYSKFGSLREQYFHTWRSFCYDENEDTIDSYILKVKQVASLLNYGEPEILGLFKNTLPSKLYWILFPINNLREAVDTAKRVMNKERLDKQLTGQASNISPFMKLRDDTHSGQQKMLNPQDLEAVSSVMYNMSLQQGKTGKPFKPQAYQKRGRGQRQSYDRDRSRNNSRQGQSFALNPPNQPVHLPGQPMNIPNPPPPPPTGIEMIIEGMGTCKISVEIMAETEAESLTVTIVVTGVGQEKEDYPPEGTIIIIGKTQILGSDQGPGVDLTQESEQIETELDVINVESMTITQMNVQMLSQVILKVMNQIMQVYKLWPQIWNQMICKILIDIWKIQNI